MTDSWIVYCFTAFLLRVIKDVGYEFARIGLLTFVFNRRVFENVRNVFEVVFRKLKRLIHN